MVLIIIILSLSCGEIEKAKIIVKAIMLTITIKKDCFMTDILPENYKNYTIIAELILTDLFLTSIKIDEIRN
jgi:hypothetical protein